MLKFVCAPSIKRVIASPRVAFEICVPLPLLFSVSSKDVDAQAPSNVVHVGPVKPLMHIHEQDPVDKEAMPPF